MHRDQEKWRSTWGKEHGDTVQPWKRNTQIILSPERWEDMFPSSHVREMGGI